MSPPLPSQATPNTSSLCSHFSMPQIILWCLLSLPVANKMGSQPTSAPTGHADFPGASCDLDSSPPKPSATGSVLPSPWRLYSLQASPLFSLLYLLWGLREIVVPSKPLRVTEACQRKRLAQSPCLSRLVLLKLVLQYSCPVLAWKAPLPRGSRGKWDMSDSWPTSPLPFRPIWI